MNLNPIDTEVSFWTGMGWKPIESIIVDITPPDEPDPETVMEFSLGT